ncbi:MAG: DUF4458 domain-containing protein [Bacteroidales bacterium]|nr:DUF4458 domain-containing protein [Bacteroidales bacterium]
MRLKLIGIVRCLLMAIALTLAGCADIQELDYREDAYGYVQFKLYKAASYDATKAVVTQLDYLKDVSKIKVTLRYGENIMSQTLVLNSSDDKAAEFGLRSDKLKLLAGNYQVVMFSLYDKVDELVYEGTPASEQSAFEVIPGGLQIHDLLADVVERGSVRFSLVKDMSGFAQTKADNEYTFDVINTVTIGVRSDAGVLTTFEKLPADFSIHFTDDGVEDGYQTSSFVCDTLLSLRAGKYNLESYMVYDERNYLLEVNSRLNVPFTIYDNNTTEVEVPVKLDQTDEYIKDYYALYEIWKALHGEEWYYVGENYPRGTNWNFNKDPDLWGDQPGVSLHANGRVALLNISDFGFYGDMPAALGQLTEMVELYLGSHNDINLVTYDPTAAVGKGTARRMERHREYLNRMHPVTQMSEPIARAYAEHGKTIPETSLYENLSETDIIDRKTGGMRIRPMDMISGQINNGLKSLPDEIGNLTKLVQLFIANSEIETLPESLANLTSCTDVEVYNCPKMTQFPMALAMMPELISLNIGNNRQWSAEEILKGFKAVATGPSKEKIQIMYMNSNNLEVVPAEIRNMKKLGMMDFSSNRIHTIEEAWGNDIKPVQIYLDNNQLSSFPVDEKGVFCYMEDAETFSVRNNNFTEFPDIFDAGSLYAVVSIDFSYNHISRFQNGKDFKGVYVETLTIANNPELTVYPIELKTSDSKIMNINFRGCNLKEFPKDCFTYPNAVFLQSFDFSYNDLKDLPGDMHAGNMPYLYGVELSYNQFSNFPWEPLDSQYLTVYAIRGQRDENGERCLSEWPVGLYNHRGLRGFYIGSNNLGKIEDTISTLIYYLDISDNPEIIFDATDICYAYQVGAYYLIYDKTQDIRNCDYMMN